MQFYSKSYLIVAAEIEDPSNVQCLALHNCNLQCSSIFIAQKLLDNWLAMLQLDVSNIQLKSIWIHYKIYTSSSEPLA